MTEKKAEKKEKAAPKKKVAVKKTVKPQSNPSVKIEALEENKYLACEIAKNLNVPDFTFYIMKQETNIEDNSFLTISEFQKIYNRIVGR